MATLLIETNDKQVREIYIFAGVLIVQSLPFIAATMLAAIERTRLNDFATWRAMQARLAQMLLWRAIAKAPAQKRELSH